MKKTKIVCTLGPSTEDIEVIRQLVEAGMNCARLNFSHGTYDQFEKIINNIRKVSKDTGQPIAIIQDLQGPKIRIGDLPREGVKVKKGETITIYDGDAYLENGEQRYIPIQYKKFTKDVKKGDTVMIDDGRVELKVIAINIACTKVECQVITDGILFSRKGVNAPNTKLSVEAMTEKDHDDLRFGLEMNVDYVALSFVRTPEDITSLRKIINKSDRKIQIIAKIERPEAMENLVEIVKEADAIMVARGDLGLEIPASRVPIAQKLIIKEANRQAKPVITATHVLNSMVESPVPTRAEVSDAANAIFDHTDAIMLSNETAVGKYPIEATKVLSNVATEIEEEIEKHGLRANRNFTDSLYSAVCLNAVELSEDIQAKYVIALTNHGYTAKQMAERRPKTKIIVFTPEPKTRNQLALVWGLNDIYCEKVDFKNPIPKIKAKLEEERRIQEGDEVVVCNSVKGSKERFISTFLT
jgi:pyruvate kinase